MTSTACSPRRASLPPAAAGRATPLWWRVSSASRPSSGSARSRSTSSATGPPSATWSSRRATGCRWTAAPARCSSASSTRSSRTSPTPGSPRCCPGPTSIRRLGVRANADYPQDAKRAREYGAEGIGLCRTEHMFFQSERLPVMQRMIMSDSVTERRDALEELRAAAAGGLPRPLPGDGRSAGHHPARRPAAARVPAHVRGAARSGSPTARSVSRRPGPSTRSTRSSAGSATTRTCSGGSRHCTSRTRCSGCAECGWRSATQRSCRCRPGRSSRRRATRPRPAGIRGPRSWCP